MRGQVKNGRGLGGGVIKTEKQGGGKKKNWEWSTAKEGVAAGKWVTAPLT